MTWHNIIENKINSNFENSNHIMPHHGIQVFFIKFVYKPSILLIYIVMKRCRRFCPNYIKKEKMLEI
jgi:hypothetical protein